MNRKLGKIYYVLQVGALVFGIALLVLLVVLVLDEVWRLENSPVMRRMGVSMILTSAAILVTAFIRLALCVVATADEHLTVLVNLVFNPFAMWTKFQARERWPKTSRAVQISLVILLLGFIFVLTG